MQNNFQEGSTLNYLLKYIPHFHLNYFILDVQCLEFLLYIFRILGLCQMWSLCNFFRSVCQCFVLFSVFFILQILLSFNKFYILIIGISACAFMVLFRKLLPVKCLQSYSLLCFYKVQDILFYVKAFDLLRLEFYSV